jgi:hypothetical protein
MTRGRLGFSWVSKEGGGIRRKERKRSNGKVLTNIFQTWFDPKQSSKFTNVLIFVLIQISKGGEGSL